MNTINDQRSTACGCAPSTGDIRNGSIDAACWPLVVLRMPNHVPDEDADELLVRIQALYGRNEPFALLLEGAELPRHSPRLMNAYAKWSRDNHALQQRYCVGAVRIEADETRRREYLAKMDGGAAARMPYPYRVVATRAQAEAQARAWLESRASAVR